MFSDDAYNSAIAKAAPGSAGTLIGNWAEERLLRDATGEGRSVPQRHVPRAGLLEDFTRTPSVYKKGDDTFNRVCGAKGGDNMGQPVSRLYGSEDRHAGKINHVGPQEAAIIRGRQGEAEAEVREEEEVAALAAMARSFETTTGSTHTPPDGTLAEKATFGRVSCHDEVMHGAPADRTLVLGSPGMDVPAHAHYSNTEMPTTQRVALGDARLRSDVRASAHSGVSAFGRNSEFSKPVQQSNMGLCKDDDLDAMYTHLASTDALRHIGGDRPKGPFSNVPSLAALKSTMHTRIQEAWGAGGYVTLRQRLFEAVDQDGFVGKQDVVGIMRDAVGVTADDATDIALDIYLSQLATVHKDRVRISSLMESLRPSLEQKQRRQVLQAFAALAAQGGGDPSGANCVDVRLGDWLDGVQNEALCATVASAFGGQDREQAGATKVTEAMFTELIADLAPLAGIDALLPCPGA